MKADHRDAAPGEVDGERLGDHVQGRLGRAVDIGAAGAVLGDRSHAAGDVDDGLQLALLAQPDEALDHAQRRHRVDLHQVGQLVVVGFYDAAARAVAAGVVYG